MPTKISDLPVGVAADLDADARFVFDDLTSGTTKQISAAVLADELGGESTLIGVGVDDTYVDVSALTLGSETPVFTQAITGVAAQDVIDIEASFKILNTSGSTQGLRLVVALNGVDFGVTGGGFRPIAHWGHSASATPSILRLSMRIIVVSSGLAFFESTSWAGQAVGSENLLGGLNCIFRQTTTSDVTGTGDLEFRCGVVSATSANTQRIAPLAIVVRRVNAA